MNEFGTSGSVDLATLLAETPNAAVAEGVLADLALALLAPTPQPGQIVVPTARAGAFRSVGGQLDAGVLLTDADGILVALSRAAERAFALRAEDAVGRPLSLLLKIERDDLAALLRDPDGTAAEIAERALGRRTDGNEFALELRATSLCAGPRRCLLLVVEPLANKDARQRTERKAELRHRLLIEHIPAVTFIAALDEGPNELYVSPQIESLLGFTQREWIDSPILWFRQLHPEDREVLNREFARGIATGGPFRAEVRVLTKDGNIVWVRGEGRLVRDEDGRPLFFHGIAFDVTDSKRAEEQMREAHEVKIRTERLAAIGQIAASISHDLRNPLGAIRNAWYYVQRKLSRSQLLQEDPRLSTLSKVVDRELARCNDIIGDLLDFVRTRTPNRSACMVNELIRDVVQVVRVQAGTVQLVTEVSADLPPVPLDAQQIERALSNLVLNAVEAVEPDGGIVRVRARLESEQVVIEVRDNGPGVRPEAAAKIFEPLFTTKARGTGLGLSIVANIVRAHGGAVTFDTGPDGTTFRMHLPM